MKLADYSIKHPAVITIILIAVVFFGFFALQGSNQEAFPAIGMPGASVVTIYPGVDAKSVERDVTAPLEDSLISLSGLSNLTSSSSDSVSSVVIEFDENVDAYAKLPEIRELVNAAMDELPEGISGDPVIIVHDMAAILPIYSVMVKSRLEPEVLTDFIENEFSPQITRIDGVSNIQIKGGVQKQLEIKLHINELEPRGLSVLDIYQLLQYSNISFPAGEISYKDEALNLRTSGEFSNIDEIQNLVVGHVDDSYVYLKDIADIEINFAEPDFYIRSDSQAVMAIDVMKRQEGNTLDIVDSLKRIEAETEEKYSGLIEFYTIADEKVTTELTINTVLKSAFTGIALAILIIYIFLHNIRSTIIIGLSIPLSMLITVIGMYLTGTTMNMLSLSGLTVAIGMIVDSSIVVLENTNRHFADSGDPAGSASIGAGEVGGAVLASATTSICVFLPMIFLSGLIGIIMKGLSLTIVIALGASALVSVIVVPYLSAQFLKEDKPRFKSTVLFHRLIDGALDKLTSGYKKILAGAIKRPLRVLIVAVVVLVLTVMLISFMGISFIPPSDTGEFEIHINTPESYSLLQTRDKIDEIDRLVTELTPEIETSIYYVGASSTLSSASKKNVAIGRIRLIGNQHRDRTVHEIVDSLQTALNNEITDIDVIVVNGGFDSLLGMATGGQGFKVRLYGNSLDQVMKSAEIVDGQLDRDPEVFKTTMSMNYGKEQLVSNLILDYLGSTGITPYEAAITSRILFNGMETGKYRTDEGNIPILLSSGVAGSDIDENTINMITLKTPSGDPIALSSLTEIDREPAVSSIAKENRNISITITGYLTTQDQMGVTGRMSEYMNNVELPYGVSWEIAGTSSLIGSSFKSLFMILGIAVFLVYMVMVIQFERFVQPFIIMISIPFTLIGVVIGLIAFGSTISIIPMLGMISLAGMVVNNGIVMIDYLNLLRKKGTELEEAVLEGCSSRLKPILMTTLTTFFGVLPMAFAFGNGSEVYAPLGQAIAGGLITSTILTLILVPVIYTLIEKRHIRRDGYDRTLSSESV